MKFQFSSSGSVTRDTIERNTEAAKRRGWPFLRDTPLHDAPLALIGGGASVERHALELRCWPGERWAINGAYGWCVDRGIDAALFTVDPSKALLADLAGVKVRRAVVAACLDPEVLDLLADADVTLFDVTDGAYRSCTGSSTAACVWVPAAVSGFRTVTFFGCESSYEEGGPFRVYDQRKAPLLMQVVCGGEKYLTDPRLVMSARTISAVIRAAPQVYRERSGGLLRAMVEHGDDLDMIAGTPELARQMGLSVG